LKGCKTPKTIGIGGNIMARGVDFSDEKLPFPLRTVETELGPVEVYDIPAGEKQAVLKKLYPFRPIPPLDRIMEDVHAEKTFRVGDFMVTREGGQNVLASPFYLESGGTVIDWIPVQESEDDEEDEEEGSR
jgi:hypothetical protein